MSHPIDERTPVFVRGVRLPFVETAGAYAELQSYELGAKAIRGLLDRTPLDAAAVELVAMGTVVHETETSNVAREAMLAAGLPSTVPGYTVSMAGASPNVAIANVCDMIALGRIEVGVASGTETFSDVPIRLGRGLRTSAMKVRMRRTLASRVEALRGLRARDLLPEAPTGSDFTTGLSMGTSCERMVRKFGTTREESDAFAARSHTLALRAWDEGRYADDVVPVVLDDGRRTDRDDSPRANATVERLAALPPVFDRRTGVNTAGNSSRYTDGAAAVLLTSAAAAQRLGLRARAAVRDTVFTGVTNLGDEMLLGPAMAIPKLLARQGITLDDVDVFEIHEAFAAQLLVNLRCLASDAFAKSHLGLPRAPGAIPLERLNTWGGSLSLGNPFAATGLRLMTTAVNRLEVGGGRYAIVATCAGGGLGSATLLERLG